MKRNSFGLIAVLIFFLSACGNSDKQKPDGAALSEEVCNCKMKTKGMKYEDEERKKIWAGCLDLQGENYKKIAADKKELEIYQKNNAACMKKFTLGD